MSLHVRPWAMSARVGGTRTKLQLVRAMCCPKVLCSVMGHVLRVLSRKAHHLLPHLGWCQCFSAIWSRDQVFFLALPWCKAPVVGLPQLHGSWVLGRVLRGRTTMDVRRRSGEAVEQTVAMRARGLCNRGQCRCSANHWHDQGVCCTSCEWMKSQSADSHHSRSG